MLCRAADDVDDAPADALAADDAADDSAEEHASDDDDDDRDEDFAPPCQFDQAFCSAAPAQQENCWSFGLILSAHYD